MPTDPALRCVACQRPLAPARGRLVCAAPECPLFGLDQESCCGGAPLDGASGAPSSDACPPRRIRWTPSEEE